MFPSRDHLPLVLKDEAGWSGSVTTAGGEPPNAFDGGRWAEGVVEG